MDLFCVWSKTVWGHSEPLPAGVGSPVSSAFCLGSSGIQWRSCCAPANPKIHCSVCPRTTALQTCRWRKRPRVDGALTDTFPSGTRWTTALTCLLQLITRVVRLIQLQMLYVCWIFVSARYTCCCNDKQTRPWLINSPCCVTYKRYLQFVLSKWILETFSHICSVLYHFAARLEERP